MNLVDVAKKYVGLKENAGPNKDSNGVITKMLTNVGVGAGNSWCAAFVSWCLKEVGAKGILCSASSQAFKRWAILNNRLITDPDQLMKCKGALGGWTDAGDPAHGHIFIVTNRYQDVNRHVTSIGTVEGNTNTNGSANGDGCYARTRTISDRYWFIDLTGIAEYWQ